MTALVEEAVSVGSLVRLLHFSEGKAGLVEVTLAEDSPACDHQVRGPRHPPRRQPGRGSPQPAGGRPPGGTVLLAGDEVIALVTVDSEDAGAESSWASSLAGGRSAVGRWPSRPVASRPVALGRSLLGRSLLGRSLLGRSLLGRSPHPSLALSPVVDFCFGIKPRNTRFRYQKRMADTPTGHGVHMTTGERRGGNWPADEDTPAPPTRSHRTTATGPDHLGSAGSHRTGAVRPLLGACRRSSLAASAGRLPPPGR